MKYRLFNTRTCSLSTAERLQIECTDAVRYIACHSPPTTRDPAHTALRHVVPHTCKYGTALLPVALLSSSKYVFLLCVVHQPAHLLGHSASLEFPQAPQDCRGGEAAVGGTTPVASDDVTAPIVIPKVFFQKLDRLISPFVWGVGRKRLKLDTLKKATDSEGAALPDFELHYLATQLAPIKLWTSIDTQCPSSAVLMTLYNQENPLLQEVLRSPIGRTQTKIYPLIQLARTIWARSQATVFVSNHPETPIWENQQLQEFTHVEAGRAWQSKGITVVHHLIQDNSLKTFDQIQQAFGK
ncbi:hypothetical protein XELAEV_18031279mg [Xenopus laevis]|uniref:Uncharacterized protein n=1 Tax=Xenopus laevis TaxID=8355 RepID=A0A974CPM9_XENLA|nr:hypothetical protein XELAEV_18031279mg [Xenopus laevis]